MALLKSSCCVRSSSKAKGFGVGLKAMKDVKADELADAINQCSVVTTVGTDNGRFVDRLASK